MRPHGGLLRCGNDVPGFGGAERRRKSEKYPKFGVPEPGEIGKSASALLLWTVFCGWPGSVDQQSTRNTLPTSMTGYDAAWRAAAAWK